MHQCTSDTCICGRPPRTDPQYLVEVGKIGHGLKVSTYRGTYFEKPHYLAGRGHALFDLKTREPIRLQGAVLYCDQDDNLYQYRNDLG